MSRWAGFSNKILFRSALVSFLTASLTACGPKEFHDQQDFSNSSTEILPSTESKITNPVGSMPGSFISNNSVAIVSNFNEKTSEYFGFCSGVRLTPYVVLTAAHCITNKEKMRIVFGTNIQHSIRSREAIFEIADIKVHDNFNNVEQSSERRYYDIALIKLKNPLPNITDDYSLVTQFDLPTTTSQYLHQVHNSEIVAPVNLQPLIAGFGVSFHKNTTTDSTRFIGALNEASVNLRPYDYSQRIVTLTSKSLSQACLGDSGGPLFIWRENRYYVQAIVISIKDKESSDPFAKTFCEKESSYLNLDYFKSWIADTIHQL